MDDWNGIERRGDFVTRQDVTNLTNRCGDLQKEINILNKAVDKQRVINRRSRLRIVAFVLVYTVIVAYGIGVMIDHHVAHCMTFGAVEDERERRICNITVPFHDHPLGGISDEKLDRALNRAIQRIQEREPVTETPTTPPFFPDSN